jgi:hypothetical protein
MPVSTFHHYNYLFDLFHKRIERSHISLRMGFYSE